MIKLHMRPDVPPCSWESFLAEAPDFSVALDGYVSGGPRYDAASPKANFNHHEDVDRLATRATCAQVHLAIRQGLFTRFRDDWGPKANVFANDCDQDVCLAYYLLSNNYRVESTMNPALNRLVTVEDLLDSTAGAYPYPEDLPLLQELAWVFAPYTSARLSGQLDGRQRDVFSGVVEQVCARLDRHLMGAGDRVALDTSFRRLREGSGWVQVEEVGAHARTGMFSRGVRAFVSSRRRADGRWQHVVGRMSRYVPFDVSAVLAAANAAEGLTSASDRWGGADDVGGSPRVAGSGLDDAAMFDLVEDVVHSGRVVR